MVDGDLHVEGEHNWITFPLDLSPGGDEIPAQSDSGADVVRSFEAPRGKARDAVIEHLTEDGSVDLTWQLQRQPNCLSRKRLEAPRSVGSSLSRLDGVWSRDPLGTLRGPILHLARSCSRGRALDARAGESGPARRPGPPQSLRRGRTRRGGGP